MSYKLRFLVAALLTAFLFSSISLADQRGKSLNNDGSFIDEVYQFVDAYFNKYKKKPHAIDDRGRIWKPRPVSMLKPLDAGVKKKAPVSMLKVEVGTVKKKAPVSPLRRINVDSKKPMLPY